MYTGLLHTHRLVVILFLLLYVVKLVLLLMQKQEVLDKFTKVTRIPEMIISFTFLATGIALLLNLAEINVMHIVKIGLVLASIPVAVIGFKRKKKFLAALSVLLIIGAYGLAEMNKIGVSNDPLNSQLVTDAQDASYDQLAHGKALYERNCVVCHGPEGNMQKSGAKNLQVSELTEEEISNLIQNGKNSMPAYGALYNQTDIEAVITYVKSFRK